MRAKRRDALLLLLAAASLLFGGGVGCDPDLDGVDFRLFSLLTIPDDKHSPRDYYMGFRGKKEPGNGRAVLSYPVKPPYGIEARMGVFLPDALAASEGAEGCIGFQKKDLAASYSLCLSYEIPTNVHIYSYGLGSTATADCAGDDKAELELADDGMNVVARYRCPGDPGFTQLTSMPTPYGAGERWFGFVGAYNLQPGGEIGFDDFDVSSEGPFVDADPEADVAWNTFMAFRFALAAFYEGEAGDLFGAQEACYDAFDPLETAFSLMDDEIADFPDSRAEKLWLKGAKGFIKSGSGFFTEKPGKYFKGAPKFTEALACAMSEMEPHF